MNWHQSIVEAAKRIGPHIRETPVEQSALCETASLFLKLENCQHTGSFKFRGATNKVSLLSAEDAARGITTASNGNHALAVAMAARVKGVSAEVYVSSTVSPEKLRRIERAGANVRVGGDGPLDAELEARRAAAKSDRVYISPYNDADVIVGQGTIGVELLQQLRFHRP